ncbi:MAG: lytic transglycosylase domain-containing protein [Paracoccaceae bacterium]
MKHILAGLYFLITSSAVSFAQDDRAAAAVTAAMEAVQKGQWSKAETAVAPAGQVGKDIVEWHRLRAGAGSFPEYIEFLDRRADWPGLPLMRQQGESRIPESADPDLVIAYFADQLPRTGTGALRLAAAWAKNGESERAEAEIVRAWRSMSLAKGNEARFLKAYSAVLAGHHEARQDMLLWRGLIKEAGRLNKLVDADHLKLAKARIALIKKSRGVSGLIKAVPEGLADDPGLAYARFEWRVAKRSADDAIAMMLERSTSAAALGMPDAWADRRRSYARLMMQDGKPEIAYQLASQHFLSEGDDYADLEWLSGFIALSDLDNPKLALEHFLAFRAAVETPISLGRAGYWEGRAHEALGQSEDAQLAYAFGGEYQTSFYGQLAAEKAGLPMDPMLTGGETYPDFRDSQYAQGSILQAALLFQKAGHPLLFTRFTRHLAEILTPQERGALAQLALDLGEPFAALYMAKYAADSGTVLMRPYFPVTDIANGDLPVSEELTLTIARRESEFYPFSTSPAGALGLMQLMPRTGKAMAKKLKVKYETDRLLSDPTYNARLGSAYLADLVEEFDGYYPFVAVGYNAGPSRAKKWVRLFGDPKRSVEDAVDWIEHIPFRETRNYVMRVMESLAVYRARLSGEVLPLRLSQELIGR